MTLLLTALTHQRYCAAFAPRAPVLKSKSHTGSRSMSSSSTAEKPNASGLTPSETKALPERAPESHEQNILKAIKELYSCKPTSSTYDIYAENATFHDPIGIATGKDSIKAQFNALAKIFPKTEITTFRVLDSQYAEKLPGSTKLLIDQTVSYFLPNPLSSSSSSSPSSPSSSSPTKTINSLLTLELDSKTHLILTHTEEWSHTLSSDSQNNNNKFFGMLNEARKKVTAKVTDMLTDKTPPNERK